MIPKQIKSLLLLIGLVAMGLTACQEEVVTLTDPQNSNVIGYGSPLADLVQRTTMKDGSADNIIDKSSCTSVVLPVSVIANGINLTIATPEDYILIERIFDQSATDKDTLIIIYPITVVLPDFEEVTVDNLEELMDLQEDCIENGADPDIECLDFVYPVTVSVYDSLNQVSAVYTLNSDQELFALFDSLDENALASFTFPLTVVLSDSTEVVVTNNQELEDVIEAAEDQCDEDDDNDYNDDDIDDSQLVAIMLDGTWEISYYADGTDRTTEFSGYVFAFLADELATATLGSLVTEGSWETYGDNGTLAVELDYDADFPLEKLNTEWVITEYSENLLKLTTTDSDEGTVVSVSFEKR